MTLEFVVQGDLSAGHFHTMCRQFHMPRIWEGEGARTGSLITCIWSEVVGVVSVEAVTHGELKAGAHEAAVLGREEAFCVRGKLVPVWRGSRYKRVGTVAQGGCEVAVPDAIGFIFARDECGLGRGGEGRGVGSSSVLECPNPGRLAQSVEYQKSRTVLVSLELPRKSVRLDLKS